MLLIAVKDQHSPACAQATVSGAINILIHDVVGQLPTHPPDRRVPEASAVAVHKVRHHHSWVVAVHSLSQAAK
jgi:hypothetical protein